MASQRSLLLVVSLGVLMTGWVMLAVGAFADEPSGVPLSADLQLAEDAPLVSWTFDEKAVGEVAVRSSRSPKFEGG